MRPAEADAEAVRIKAKADSEATKLQAEAAASNDRVALERMIIEQLPQLVSNAGSSLARANVTVLNGSDGLSQIAAGLVSQALAIYNEARQGLVANNGNIDGNGNGHGHRAVFGRRPGGHPADSQPDGSLGSRGATGGRGARVDERSDVPGRRLDIAIGAAALTDPRDDKSPRLRGLFG